MADEATVRISLSVKTTNLDHRSYPTAFVTDVGGEKGPTPGAITVTIAGTDIDLSEITIPGLCWMQNIDATNYINIGIWDPEIGVFYPMIELRPGEYWLFRLSRDLFGEYGTGEGTSGPNTNRLRAKADVASGTLVVKAFEA